MSDVIPLSIHRCRMMVMAAAVAFLLAVETGMPLRSCFDSPLAVMGALSIVLGGLVAAIALRDVANLVLRDSEEPWYGRRGGVLLLAVFLVMINGVLLLADRAVFTSITINRAFPQPARLLVAFSMELLWIPLLDWPEHSLVSRIQAHGKPRGSVFKSLGRALTTGWTSTERSDASPHGTTPRFRTYRRRSSLWKRFFNNSGGRDPTD